MSSTPAQHLNVLHVLSDQHLATCMGVEGHSQAITPNMDRLAARGVRFTHAYTQNPICTPSRTSILSGQYCHNHGYYGLSGPAPLRLPTLFGHFRTAGYRTAGIGKLHLPNDPEDWAKPDLDLYDECYEYGRGANHPSPYFAYLERLGLREKEDSIALPEFPGAQQHEGRPSNLPFEHSVEGWCVQEAVRFMDGCGDAPFMMQVSLPRPHQCYTPDRRFWDLYPGDLALPPTLLQDASHRAPHFRATVAGYRTQTGLIEPKGFEQVARRVWRAYLACITQVDHALGLLLDHLERTGKAQNTIVIYGSDHGAYSGTHGIPEKAPGICSEAVCRVPYIWHVPGVTPPGHVSGQLVENIDLAPTVTSLCGLPPMETVDGYDISPLLRGEDRAVREVAVTENVWSKSLRWRQWRFVHYQPEMWPGQEVGELYDVDADPNETHNLYQSPAHSNVVHECRRLLLEWLIATTRTVTVNPAPAVDPTGPRRYPTAADGKEPNTAGPAARLAGGQRNYL